ncbi:hypothetical protein F5Y03DRAFT_77413 [Xylaria venustula]|nr:hypothetical protein F5Y03DRAFT_77413 [Xylaria venustula]
MGRQVETGANPQVGELQAICNFGPEKLETNHFPQQVRPFTIAVLMEIWLQFCESERHVRIRLLLHGPRIPLSISMVRYLELVWMKIGACTIIASGMRHAKTKKIRRGRIIFASGEARAETNILYMSARHSTHKKRKRVSDQFDSIGRWSARPETSLTPCRHQEAPLTRRQEKSSLYATKYRSIPRPQKLPILTDTSSLGSVRMLLDPLAIEKRSQRRNR